MNLLQFWVPTFRLNWDHCLNMQSTLLNHKARILYTPFYWNEWNVKDSVSLGFKNSIFILKPGWVFTQQTETASVLKNLWLHPHKLGQIDELISPQTQSNRNLHAIFPLAVYLTEVLWVLPKNALRREILQQLHCFL